MLGEPNPLAGCMMEHLAGHYAVHRFLARVERANEKSIAVLRRLGFTEAGIDESMCHALTTTERQFVADVGNEVTDAGWALQ